MPCVRGYAGTKRVIAIESSGYASSVILEMYLQSNVYKGLLGQCLQRYCIGGDVQEKSISYCVVHLEEKLIQEKYSLFIHVFQKGLLNQLLLQVEVYNGVVIRIYTSGYAS